MTYLLAFIIPEILIELKGLDLGFLTWVTGLFVEWGKSALYFCISLANDTPFCIIHTWPYKALGVTIWPDPMDPDPTWQVSVLDRSSFVRSIHFKNLDSTRVRVRVGSDWVITLKIHIFQCFLIGSFGSVRVRFDHVFILFFITQQSETHRVRFGFGSSYIYIVVALKEFFFCFIWSGKDSCSNMNIYHIYPNFKINQAIVHI